MTSATAMPEPLLVEDANEEWWQRTPEYRAAVNAWLVCEGIDNVDLKRIEVFLVDAPFARLTFTVRDSEGRAVVDAATETVLTRTETRLLSSLPPLAGVRDA